jgi:outer membrane lipoprotein-sorting protein
MLRELRAALAALLLAAVASPAFAAFELGELMALLARQRSGEARFVEQRHVQGLDQPLSARGTLSFSAPDRFTRHTLEPRAETMSVQGNTVSLARNGRTRSFALDSAPEMAAIVEALRGTLTGDAAALQRHFRPALSGSAEQWTLELAPLDARLAGQVRGLRIVGRRAELSSVEVQLADGDRSTMTIEPVARAASAP